jgi:predicted enzyme related to lactoylglutathione lyase
MATWARPVVHWEIQARDPERIRAFYESMFEWKMAPGPVPSIVNIDAGIGGPEPGPAGHIQPGDVARVVLYIQVADIRASMQQAEQLGGAVLVQPFDVPGGPTVARIADPEGNQIALLQQ